MDLIGMSVSVSVTRLPRGLHLLPAATTKTGEMNPADHHHLHLESIVWFRKDRAKDVAVKCSINQRRRRVHLKIPPMAGYLRPIKIQTMVA